MDVYTTDVVPPRARFAYWREAICDVFVSLDAERPAGPHPPALGFSGRIACTAAGSVRLSEVTSDPQHVVRSPRQIARSSEDDFLVSLQVSGRGRVEQDGRSAALVPGEFALYDSTRPYVLHFDGAFRQLVLQFPRSALRARLEGADRATAVRVPAAGAGAVVGAFTRALAEQAPSLDASTADRLGAHGLDLLADALAAVGGLGPADADAVRGAQRRRAQAFIEAHLDDPGLCPADVAAALHVSVRTLHKAFGGGETVGRFLTRRRLARAAADLADPARRRTVTDVAFAWGFRDAAHFSRAFKDRYGVSPRDYRGEQPRAGWQG